LQLLIEHLFLHCLSGLWCVCTVLLYFIVNIVHRYYWTRLPVTSMCNLHNTDKSYIVPKYMKFVCTNFIHLEVYIQVYMTTVNSLNIFISCVCVAQSLVFFVVLSRSLFVILSCLCLYFFDLCLLITPLVSSNLSE
jgi:hypothetical protein